MDHHFEHLKNEEELAKVQVEPQSHHFLQDYDHKKLQDYLKILDEAIEQGQQEGLEVVYPSKSSSLGYFWCN